MSFKAKDLHYEKQEPAFLRRLKGQYDAGDGRNNVQIARPKKSRLKTGDGEEDEPTIVDENGEIVARAQYESMQRLEGDSAVPAPHDTKASGEDTEGNSESTTHRDKQHIVELGGARKRKQARVIGDDADDDNTKTVGSIQSKVNVKDQTVPQSSSKESSTKPKKKSKKIKLSFDEPE